MDEFTVSFVRGLGIFTSLFLVTNIQQIYTEYKARKSIHMIKQEDIKENIKDENGDLEYSKLFDL